MVFIDCIDFAPEARVLADPVLQNVFKLMKFLRRRRVLALFVFMLSITQKAIAFLALHIVRESRSN